MVWLNAANENGSGLYLYIHHIEKLTQSQFTLHGTLGDGYYEGEVLVEMGEGTDVTFVDEWLDREALVDFFSRVERNAVELALAERAADLIAEERELLWCESGARSSFGRSRAKMPRVREERALWEAA